MQKSVSKSHSMLKSVSKLIKIGILYDRKLLFYTIFYMIGMGITPLITIVFIRRIVDALSTKGDRRLQDVLFLTVLFLCAAALAQTVAIYTESKADNLFTRLRMEIQNRLNQNMLALSYEKLEDSDFINQNYRMFHSLNSSQTGAEYVLKGLFLLSGTFFSLISMLFVIGGFLLFLPVLFMGYLFLVIWIGKKSAECKNRLKEHLGYSEKELDYVFRTANNLRPFKDIKIYKGAGFLAEKINNAIGRLKFWERKAAFTKTRKGLAAFLYLLIISIVSFVCLVFAFQKKEITISDVSAFMFAILGLLGLSDEMKLNIEKILYEAYSVEELFSFLDENQEQAGIGGRAQRVPGEESRMQSGPQIKDETERKSQSQIEDETERKNKPQIGDERKRENKSSAGYEWEIEHLSFQYKNMDQTALKGINLQIAAGEKIALVGLNGAGKSTLIKCMSGLYKNFAGSIKFRGTNINELDKGVFCKACKVLYQDADVYPFSVGENVASRDSYIDMEQVKKALAKVGLADILDNNEEGKQYIKKLFSPDGIELSGGQTQRLLLSRLLYSQPDILILDEPTSNLDSYGEEKMVAMLLKEFSNQSIFFVTHRLSCVYMMDRIIVMKEGRIVEMGTHKELLSKKGEYFRLIEIQKNYYAKKAV